MARERLAADYVRGHGLEIGGLHMPLHAPDGTLLYAIPDKRCTFDRDREVTPLAHVVRDHRDGPAWSRHAHYEDWAAKVEHRPDFRRRALELRELGYSIHFHVWDRPGLLELAAHLAMTIDLEVELVLANLTETIVVFRAPA